MSWTTEETDLAAELGVDTNRIEEVSARLDLRPPNRDALESLVLELGSHYMAENRPAPFECVLDSATGVGKTYIMAAALDYLVGTGQTRNVVIVAPGRTILNKTIANFTPGHPKSLLGSMAVEPVLVTTENFASAATRASIDDDSVTKIYVFTVQSLTSPTTKTGRKTHDFQEGLGDGFYKHLAAMDDLVVFADEHHCYTGPKFSAAVHGLEPYAIVGLTATPAKSTPDEQIVYRYPLAAAIADGFVKVPVLVGRKDDRSDPETKLADGVALLKAKKNYLDAHAAETGTTPVNPVMLVVAKDTTEADEIGAILSSSSFDGGAWADGVLVVHSNLTGDAKEAALADLDSVDQPDSTVRIIISVGMLKEGWDVRTVYVIASMRASVSTVLTEQTLGRGLRLPFGKRTGIEMLDTLEVLAHESYGDLLKKAGVLQEQFIDRRTRAVLRRNSKGNVVVVAEDEASAAPIIPTDDSNTTGTDISGESEPGITITPTDDRTGGPPPTQTLEAIADRPEINVPRLSMTPVKGTFRLADITDLDQFRKLGSTIASDPENELRRTLISASVTRGADGLRSTQMVTRTASDRLDSSSHLFPIEDLREQLVDAVLASPAVPTRPDQAKQVQPIIDAFLAGLGPDADKHLSAYMGRATGRLIGLVTAAQRDVLSKPEFDEVVEVTRIGGPRILTRSVTGDHRGPFARSTAYDGWDRGLYEADWFDSSTERWLAVIVDDTESVQCWVRLHTGELPILWTSDSRRYNADFIVVDSDAHWVVEVKANKDADNTEVLAKRQAAQRWVNFVNADDKVTVTWRYLLVTEADIADSQDSWPALKLLGS